MKTFDLKLGETTYPNCSFTVGTYRYGGGRYIHIVQNTCEGQEDIADVTANISTPMPKGCIAVKDYSENTGMLREMQRLGVVTEVLAFCPSGYVSLPVCKYDEEVLNEYCGTAA